MGARRRFLAVLVAVVVLGGLAGPAGPADATTGIPSVCTVTAGRLQVQPVALDGLYVRYTSWGVKCPSTIRLKAWYITQRWYGGTDWRWDNQLPLSIRNGIAAADFNIECSRAGALIRARLTLRFFHYADGAWREMSASTYTGSTTTLCA